MKYQALFSPKNYEKIFKTVICCSHDWSLKGKTQVLSPLKQSQNSRSVLKGKQSFSRLNNMIDIHLWGHFYYLEYLRGNGL